ncbi:MAG: glycosyltransferase [Deltaproteobacteria bacterium]|nr:glycosyltransferase [Deltaproteobacteria bacterium]
MQPKSPEVPTVSVVMAVYNERPAFLRQAIDSILAQTMSAFEFVIVDDGSTSEEVPTILREYANRDARIKVFRQPQSGLSVALNEGIDRCSSEWVFRQDSDDWSEPNRLQVMLDHLRLNPELGLLGSFASMHQEDGGALWIAKRPEEHAEICEYLRTGNPFIHGSVAFKKGVFEQVGKYNSRIRYAQDYELFVRMSREVRTQNLSQPLYHFRYTATAAEKAVMYTAIEQRIKVESSAGDGTECNEQSVADLTRVGDRLLLAGSYARCCRTYAKLLCADPFNPRIWAKALRALSFVCLPRLRRHLFPDTLPLGCREN